MKRLEDIVFIIEVKKYCSQFYWTSQHLKMCGLKYCFEGDLKYDKETALIDVINFMNRNGFSYEIKDGDK